MHPLTALLELLAPPRCLACRARAPLPWCSGCAAIAGRLRVRRQCTRCGLGASAGGGSLAGDTPADHGCWPDSVPIATTVAAFRYTGPVAAAVVAGKAHGASAAWPLLGALLAGAVTSGGPPEVDVVTWVPADAARVRQRGADHAEALARPVGAALGLAVRPLLSGRRRQADQAGLSLARRRALPDDAFRARGALSGARVLLVDDVLTTGATARAAARALTAAHATCVHLAVLARAGHHRLRLSEQESSRS